MACVEDDLREREDEEFGLIVREGLGGGGNLRNICMAVVMRDKLIKQNWRRLLTERETKWPLLSTTWSSIWRMRIFRSDKNGRLRISRTMLEPL